jgi:hypothetical protein
VRQTDNEFFGFCVNLRQVRGGAINSLHRDNVVCSCPLVLRVSADGWMATQGDDNGVTGRVTILTHISSGRLWWCGLGMK